MADNYNQFDKSDQSPIVPEIRISTYSFRVREIILAAVALVGLVVVLVLAVLLSTAKPNSDSGSIAGAASAITAQSPLCLTKPCLQSAAVALTNINSSVKPCDNFFEYACGGFKQRNPLDPETSQRTIFWNLYYDNEKKLRTLLEAPLKSTSTSTWSYERKLKDLFMSCLDDYGKMNAGGTAFINKIVQPLGGWWVIDTWNQNAWNLNTAVQKTNIDFWTSALFTFRVATDRYNRRNRVIEVDFAGMGMAWSYYTRSDTTQVQNDYKTFMRTVAHLLLRDSGSTLDDATKTQRVETFINDAYNIEFQLANITANTVPTGDPHNHEKRITLADFTSQTGGVIDFTAFFNYMFRDAGVTANTKVILMENDWLRRMVSMVANLPADTKNRSLHNYMIWRLAQSYVSELSWEYIHASRQFYVDLYGIPQFLGTWQHCFNYATQHMGDALSALFVNDHFADKNREKTELAAVTRLKKAHEIVNYVKQQLIDSTTNNMFMDSATKDIAKDKLKAAVDKLGYPDKLLDDGQLNNIYQSLDINRTDYFQNLLNLNKFEKAEWNRRLRIGEDQTEWLYKTYDTTMTFYNSWNQLLVPAGMLQFPVYEWTMPHFFNFGSMGGLVGHYFVHAIDTWGGYYDKTGAFGNWWTNYTIQNYRTAENCFAGVYSNKTMGPYNVPGQSQPQLVQVNGPNFAWEAMAETSGIRVAYKAYKKWIQDNGAEKLSPGLDSTNDMMFFLSYAQTTCFNRNDYLSFNYASSQRVPENIRTNTVLSMLDEFTKAYNCPAGSAMNSKTKCNTF